MKNTKLFATLGAVALVGAIGIGSTLAYLSDTAGPVTNTFTMGTVTFNKDLKGGLAEQVPTLDGTTYSIEDGAAWVNGFDYEKVTPGENLPKNPTAFVGKGSEDAYLFVLVSNSADYSKINYTAEFKDGKLGVVKDKAGKEYTLFIAKKPVSAPANIEEDPEGHTIFTDVTVDKETTKTEGLDDIEIKAALVQSDNVTVAEATAAAKTLFEVTDVVVADGE